MIKKTIPILLIFLILIANFVFAYSDGELIKPVDVSELITQDIPLLNLPYYSQPLTTAGEIRGCAKYPQGWPADSATHIFKATSTSTTFDNACEGQYSLVNLYSCTNNAPLCNDGMPFLAELETGSKYTSFQVGKYYAYQCYTCPEIKWCDISNTRTCVTETSYAICGLVRDPLTNKYLYGTPQSCSPGTKCGYGGAIGTLPGYCTALCTPSWQVAEWGTCGSDGYRTRLVWDSHNCQVETNKPANREACVPQPNSYWIGTPTVNTASVEPDSEVIVTQTFHAGKADTYLLEAGIEKISGLAITKVTGNTCNPDEPWYANKEVYLAAGDHVLQFSVWPQEEGRFVYHTAYVTACGGDVITQSNGLGQVTVQKIPQPICGNYVCEDGETNANCPSDCILNTCGNGACDSQETTANCPSDCGDGQTNNPQLFLIPGTTTLSAENNTMYVNFGLQNNGDNMVSPYIIEIQVRPKGQLPLALLSEEQRVCDPNHPENVYKTIQLNAGEAGWLHYDILNIADGSYDVYGVSVDKCYYDDATCYDISKNCVGSNKKVLPFGGGALLDTLKISGGQADPTNPIVTICDKGEFMCFFDSAFGFLAYPVIIAIILLILLIGYEIYYSYKHQKQ